MIFWCCISKWKSTFFSFKLALNPLFQISFLKLSKYNWETREWLFLFCFCLFICFFFINFLSLRVFGLLSSSLLLFPQRFGLMCPPAFFRCLSNSGTFTELRTRSFIEFTGVACSDSVTYNWVQVLSIPVL